MKTNTHFRLLTLLVLTLAFSLPPSALLQADPLGTAFTYQGQLTDGGAPANGDYDLKFALYDSAGGANVINAPLTNAAAPVSNGLFTVALDFGGSVFTGNARWLQIGVRTNGSSSDFVLLSPRQALTATPFARYATSAGNAASAGTATTADSATTVAPNGVNSASLQTGAVTSDKIASGAVETADLANNAVTAAKIAASSVDSARIVDGAIGTADMADSAVTSGKIAAGSIISVKIATNSVDSARIADGAIMDADVNASGISGGKIIGGDLQAARLKVGTSHSLSGTWATIVGGSGNSVSRDYAVVGGGSQNTNAGFASGILAGNKNNIKTNANYSVIGGGIVNYVSGSYATVGGGFSCGAADYGFVGGGEANSASQVHAVVSGGKNNMARGVLAFVGGGEYNYATNSYATIPGGYNNQANGSYSFAAGCLARANHTGAFVWADSQNAFFNSTASNQVSFRCQGGVRFTSASGAANQTVSWTPGSGSWSFSSDRALKEGFVPVDSQTVLEKVSRLPVSEWNYAGYSQRHIGPMAQDFHTAFPLSGSDTMLNDADLHGVALAAIQGLNQKVESENAALKQEVAALKRLVSQLSDKLNGGAK
jgi:hypothetical protein